MNRICIISNSLKDKDLSIGKEIRDSFLKLAYEKGMADAQAPLLDICDVYLDIPSGMQGIIVIGGDGSVLSAAKKSGKYELPIIGFNLGAVGYLAEVELSNANDALTRLLEDNYSVEERMMLAGSVQKDGEDEIKGVALNDVVLSRRGDMQITCYRICVNGSFLSDFNADGIILSTPTGSTAYNLSAGGAIVEPVAKLIQLTPVAPHMLNTRSVILSGDDEISVTIMPPKGLRPVDVGAYFDGDMKTTLHPGDSVTVTMSDHVTRVIRLSDDGFLQTLHKKMI
ncbi:NAD+ kinase [Lachnospiraceae bacterium XPB1003]|nr:NAD+ kinase [Lachnospiraceae bacterium XPB1003]